MQQSSQSSDNQAAPRANSITRAVAGAPNFLAVWVPIVVSVISLVIAAASWLAATEDPELLMTLPNRIRVVQGGDFPVVFVQLKFVSSGRNERLDVIDDIKLHAEPIDGGASVDFKWYEIGVFSPDGNGDLTYKYGSDAGPLIVSPTNPQQPVARFNGPADFKFETGKYRVTISATRTVGKTPLEASFMVDFGQEDITTMNQSFGGRYREMEIQR